MCVTVPIPNPRRVVALSTTERKDGSSAHTPSPHKGQIVQNFLCEDSCICGRLLRSGNVSLGVPLLLLRSPLKALSFSYSLCSILSPFSCRLRLPPRCPASMFTPHPLCSVHRTTDRSAVSSSQHPVQSHNAPACPCSLGEIPLPPRVSGHMLSLVSCGRGKRTLLICFFSLFFRN